MRRIVALDRSDLLWPEPRRSRSVAARPDTGTVVALLVVLLVAGLVLAHVRQPDGVVGESTYLVATVGAGLVALVAALRRRRGERRVALLVAAGVGASAIADALYLAVTMATGVEPEVSIGDPFWVASYVFLIAAVLSRPTATGFGASVDVDELIDFVSSSVVVILVLAHVVDLGGLLADTSVPAGVRLVWATYPVLDAIMLAGLARAVFAGRHRGRSGWYLSVGVGAWLASDLGYMVGSDGYAGGWLDAGWMVGAVAIAAAVVVPAPQPEPDEAPDPAAISSARIALTLAPLLVPSVLDLIAHRRGVDSHPLALTLGSAVLIVCALGRAARLVRIRNVQREQLRSQEHFARVLADSSSDASVVVDRGGAILRPSSQLASMLGTGGSDGAGCDLVALVPAGERERLRILLERVAVTPSIRMTTEIAVADDGGTTRWLQLAAVNLEHDPVVGGIVVNLVDVTQRKLAEQERDHLALHDTLTRLPNRALFQERVQVALERRGRAGRGVAVLYLDIDDFEQVNDRFGHATGDCVLTQFAGRLVDLVGTEDTVARVGGDEFAILVDARERPSDAARRLAESIAAACAVPIRCEGHEVALTASIGVAVSDERSEPVVLLRDADVAMRQSKAGGKAQTTMFDEQLGEVVGRTRRLEADVASAAADGQLFLEYQPVVDLASGAVVGLEALVRWQHPQLGLIRPDVFIPIAEAKGAMRAIGWWVLRTACRTIAGWPAERGDVTLGVNLSACQLADPLLVHGIVETLAASGLPPTRLVLEVTESALVDDPESAALRLRELRDLGIRLAIDDFGTGYSSLSYLRQFPFDVLKIDRSFIESITEDGGMPPIVLGLLELGRRLGLEVIAEGIEHAWQAAVLREHDCPFGQGYHFARPLEPEAARRLVAAAPVSTHVVELAR